MAIFLFQSFPFRISFILNYVDCTYSAHPSSPVAAFFFTDCCARLRCIYKWLEQLLPLEILDFLHLTNWHLIIERCNICKIDHYYVKSLWIWTQIQMIKYEPFVNQRILSLFFLFILPIFFSINVFSPGNNINSELSSDFLWKSHINPHR